MRKTVLIRRTAVLLTLLCCILSGCGGSSAAAVAVSKTAAEPFPVPEFRDAAFHPDQAEKHGMLEFDFSAAAEGYVGVRASSDKALKFQIQCGETKYNYSLSNQGEATIFPLNMENGSYTFRLLESVGGTKYSVPWTDTRQVKLEDEFAPYLRPSQLVPYGADSQCVGLARDLAASCETDSDVVAAIYDYLVRNIRYDTPKASTVTAGYLPDPDSTLAERMGICFDYASLAAAMMRSLGIPCKLIMGYVDESVYHAWNCFYLQEQGWVTVEIKAKPGLWQRVDITMAASGRRTAELEDDSNYTTRYAY